MSRIAERGWWSMSCWNALSEAQQRRLIEWGNLPLGYEPEAKTCRRGARVAVELDTDEAPGPRFYCLTCAAQHLLGAVARRKKAEMYFGDTFDSNVYLPLEPEQ